MDTPDKKTHILVKAEEIFAVKGYEAATVRDIAEAAKVNLAMISYYFGSKELLLEELFRRRMATMQMKMEQLLGDKNLSPFAKVEIVLEDYVNKVVRSQAFYKIMLCEQVMRKNETVIRLIRELKLNYATLFSAIVKEGQQKKQFKKKVDIVLALTTMTGTVTQLIVNREQYMEFNGITTTDENEINKLLFDLLSNHLKSLFKSILLYEA